jgi:hypothetical protein
MIQPYVTILLLGIMCTQALGADSAKDRLKAATANGPMAGYTWEKEESAKSRLKAATSDGPMPGYTWEKSSSAKNKLNEATDAVPSYGTFSSDNSRCAYLTKPNVREDGGGLNAHAGGSVVCHLGRIMYCSAGAWIDRGNCDWSQEHQAYWIEGSPPPGTPNKEGGPEGPGGGNQAGGGGAAQGSQSILLGENPREQQLEKERQQLLNEVQQLRQMQQGGREGQRQGAPPQQGIPPQGQGSSQTGTPNRTTITGVTGSFTCAQAKEALDVFGREIHEIEVYSRGTTTVPGAIHQIYQERYNQIVTRRSQIEQWVNENNCN